MPLGLPVAAEFCRPPLGEPERHALKRSLGSSGQFLVVSPAAPKARVVCDRRTVAVLAKNATSTSPSSAAAIGCFAGGSPGWRNGLAAG